MKLRLKVTVLLIILMSAVAGWLPVGASDSAFKPIKLTGWNADVVFEKTAFAASSKATSFDWPDQRPSGYPLYAWFEAGLKGHADGFPKSRRFASAANTNVVFEFQPYTTNNVLLLTVAKPSGRLVMVEPAAYRSLFVLAAAGGGDGEGTLRLNFTDGTDSEPIAFAAPDWCASSPQPRVNRTPAISGLARSNGKQGFKYTDMRRAFGEAGFALYQTEIDLTALGLHGKTILNISFNKRGSSATAGIFAISGERSKSSDSPTIELERR